MRYLSVTSGIEAATVAWHPLGWHPVAFAQHDPDHDYSRGVPDFASAVLAHHYPDIANLGDIELFRAWPDGFEGKSEGGAAFDLLVGGTPCQSFSIAGLREGLADPRGNLALVYLAILERYRPRWFVWENVPGVLSSNSGQDFGTFLAGVAELGYGWAYRVLDAQYVRVDGYGRAVPQRRRRVFVVGHSAGSFLYPAAVLFDRESLRGNSPPRRGKTEIVAGTLAGGARGRGGYSLDDIPVAASLTASDGGLSGKDAADGRVIPVLAFGGNDTRGPIEVATACRAKGGTGHGDFESETFIAHPTTATLDASYGRLQGCSGQDLNHGLSTLVAHTLRADGFDASEDGTGRGTPLVPVFNFNGRQDPVPQADVSGPLDTDGTTQCVSVGWRVRRLTPLECERLQGFPDGYTDILYRRRRAADGPRYMVLGNSMAVNVMRWLGHRVRHVDGLIRELRGAA